MDKMSVVLSKAALTVFGIGVLKLVTMIFSEFTSIPLKTPVTSVFSYILMVQLLPKSKRVI